MHTIKKCLAITFLISVTGCTVLGPDYHPEEDIKLPSTWNKVDGQQVLNDTIQWWMQFNDPTLNTLVEHANQQNLDIEAAGLRILQARMALGITSSYQYPQLQVTSGHLASIHKGDQSYSSAALSFDAGWEMDVWGKYARGLESAEASLYSSIASYHDIAISITAEVVRNYVNYRTYQERILLSKRNINIQSRIVDITKVQFDSGDVTELDVQQATSQLYSTRAALPALKIGMRQSRNALAVLLGVLPENIVPMLTTASVKDRINSVKTQDSRRDLSAFVLTYDAHSLIPEPPELEASINASLVMRRPDLQIAELQAHAQSARIGMAVTELYPSFSLFGSIGVNSLEESTSSFSFSDSLTLSIGPSFSWNIFQYGRVKDNIRLEDARFQEALTNYNKKVLLAVLEVNNALDAYQLYKIQKELRLNSVNASVRAFNISMAQYENGQINFQRLLTSVEKMTRSEDSHAQTKGNIANQVVALYKSLGGGWEANTGKAFVKPNQIKTMEKRTDWGDKLGNLQVPPINNKRGE